MKIARSEADVVRDPNSVVTVGTFDGIHLGHRQIIMETVRRARARTGRSVIVTFEPHPKEVVASTRGPVRLLTTMEERLALLGGFDIDLVYIIEFTRAFSQLAPRAFYETHVSGTVGLAEVVVGYDHMFGRGRAAGNEELADMGTELRFVVRTVPALTVDGDRVSSTVIRHALAAGDVERAARLLGYAYRLDGRVVEGNRRGLTLGYPTANIRPESEKKLVPARGVYLVSVRMKDQDLFGMMNIGMRPTVTDGSDQTIEVYVLNFQGDLYGDRLSIRFLRKLRDEQKFASAAELKEQLDRDRERSLAVIRELTNTTV